MNPVHNQVFHRHLAAQFKQLDTRDIIVISFVQQFQWLQGRQKTKKCGFIHFQRNVDPALGGSRFRRLDILINEKSVESAKKLGLYLDQNSVISDLKLIYEDDHFYYILPPKNIKNKISIVIPKKNTDGVCYLK